LVLFKNVLFSEQVDAEFVGQLRTVKKVTLSPRGLATDDAGQLLDKRTLSRHRDR
jgi:hypothetical protein